MGKRKQRVKVLIIKGGYKFMIPEKDATWIIKCMQKTPNEDNHIFFGKMRYINTAHVVGIFDDGDFPGTLLSDNEIKGFEKK